MGVPKFFRWCAERYPNITRNLGNYAPPMDNLYLDVNGIIHNCTHPNDVDVLKRAPTQREMIHAIFIYLERLFNAVQPRKHFMVAVDGVAPRAKMNQQRQRRYRAGYEMMIAREEALDRGEEVPEETAVFDSNCITPGTPFMVLVSEKIQYFLAMKVASDPAWQKCKIIYSGHDCPGEGEHKIVEFIRRRKMEPGYSPNETHCMYGLDADLVMLAITTHEPRFVLLREEVTFGNNNNNNNGKDNKNGNGGRGGGSRSEIWKEDPRLMTNHTFVLLDIGLLRDYLALEIREICLSNDVTPNHDLERFLDDFVFTCFFIGNDFLPSIPTVGINDDSIIQMLHFYVREVRRKDGYLTHHGKIQWQFVELWLNALGKTEMEVIRKRQQEEDQYQKRRARIDPSYEAKSSLDKTFESIAEYKQHFYTAKHKMPAGYQPTSEEMRALRRHYIEGLTWVMEYYYQGPPSWKWFFPHYYAPMASDLVGLVALAQGVVFEDSSPFLPHQQLLAVLPPMSYRCLPPAYWPLLKNPNSPLASVFPDHIEIDREGTRASWEGIVLIPFMEEEQLLAAYESVQAELTEEDRRHNKLGPALEIFYDSKVTVDVIDDMFPTLREIHVRRQPFTLPPPRPFVPVLCDGFDPKRVMEGFGALVSPHALKVSYGREAVKVFDMPSRRESLLLNFTCAAEMNDVEKLKEYLGQEVLVGYPYWRRARLEMLENDTCKTFRNYNTNQITSMNVTGVPPNHFQTNTQKHATLLLQRQGIKIETVPVLAYVCLFTGMEENERGVLRRQYSQSAVEYPIQLLTPLREIDLIEDPRFKERPRLSTDGYAPQECCVVIREKPSKADRRQSDFFGSVGRVVPTEHSAHTPSSLPTGSEQHQQPNQNNAAKKTKQLYSIRVKLPESIQVPQNILDYNAAGNWKSSYDVSLALKLKPNTVTILCGSCTTTAQYGSRELGLPIKFDLQSLSRVGYAKLVHKLANADKVTEYSRIAKDAPPEGHYLSPKSRNNGTDCRRRDGIWLLSSRAVKLLCEYVAAFPPVVRYIESTGGDVRNFDPMEFLRDEWADRQVEDVIDEIETFVKRSGLLEAPVMSSWEDTISLQELHDFEQQLVELEQARKLKPQPNILLKGVSADQLFFPASRSDGGQIISFPLKIPNKRSVIYRLGSRVVNCCVTGSVPFGATGTIVRFFYARDAEVVYDEPFVGATTLGGRLRTDRGAVQRLHYLLPLNSTQQPTRENICDRVITQFIEAGRFPALQGDHPTGQQGAAAHVPRYVPSVNAAPFVPAHEKMTASMATAEPVSLVSRRTPSAVSPQEFFAFAAAQAAAANYNNNNHTTNNTPHNNNNNQTGAAGNVATQLQLQLNQKGGIITAGRASSPNTLLPSSSAAAAPAPPQYRSPGHNADAAAAAASSSHGTRHVAQFFGGSPPPPLPAQQQQQQQLQQQKQLSPSTSDNSTHINTTISSATNYSGNSDAIRKLSATISQNGGGAGTGTAAAVPAPTPQPSSEMSMAAMLKNSSLNVSSSDAPATAVPRPITVSASPFMPRAAPMSIPLEYMTKAEDLRGFNFARSCQEMMEAQTKEIVQKRK